MRRVHSCYEESEATAMVRRNASFLTAPKWVRFETAKYLLLLEANRPKWVRLVFLLFFARASTPYAQTVRLVSRSPPFTPLRLS